MAISSCSEMYDWTLSLFPSRYAIPASASTKSPVESPVLDDLGIRKKNPIPTRGMGFSGVT